MSLSQLKSTLTVPCGLRAVTVAAMLMNRLYTLIARSASKQVTIVLGTFSSARPVQAKPKDSRLLGSADAHSFVTLGSGSPPNSYAELIISHRAAVVVN